MYILVLLSAYLSLSHSQTPYENYKARSSERWTIANWFETKRQISLMDQWLSKNRKSQNIFDIDVGAFYRETDTNLQPANTSASENSTSYYGTQLNFYIYMIGLEGTYLQNKNSSSDHQLSTSLHLRLLGNNNQTTRWTIYYGKHYSSTASEEWEPTFYGTKLTVYIVKFLGIEGSYTEFLKQDTKSSLEGSGTKKDISVFTDIYFLRLYGKWIKEDLEFKNALDEINKEEHKSFEFGFAFFF